MWSFQVSLPEDADVSWIAARLTPVGRILSNNNAILFTALTVNGAQDELLNARMFLYQPTGKV